MTEESEPNSHLSEDVLKALLTGTLNGSDLDRAEAHLTVCSDCEDRLDRVAEHLQQSLDESLLRSSVASDMDPELIGRIQQQANVDSASDSGFPSQESEPRFEAKLRYTGRMLKGGLGEVLLCEDPGLRRLVAVKSLRSDKPATPGRVYRFRREYEVTSRLQHPGVPAVYGRGTYANGREFYVMQFIDGETLEKRLEALHRSPDFRLQRSNQDFVKLIEQFIDICETLQAAHRQGILHRDLKPENIVIDADDRAVVLDWGLAGFTNRSNSETVGLGDNGTAESPTENDLRLTHDSQTLGTIAWMSPEQAAGKSQDYDRQTDVYGLGAILFQILTGVPPHSDAAGGWHSTTAGPDEDAEARNLRLQDRLAQIAAGRHPQVRRSGGERVPPELETICRLAIHPDKQHRLASAELLATELRSWLTMSAVSSHRYTAYERWSRLVAKYPATVLLAAGLLGTVLLVLWLTGAARRRELTAELRGQNTAASQQSMILSGLADEVQSLGGRLRAGQSGSDDLPAPVFIEESPQNDVVPIGSVGEAELMIGRFLIRFHEIQEEQTGHLTARQAVEKARAHAHNAGIYLSRLRDNESAEAEYAAAISSLDKALQHPDTQNERDQSLLWMTQVSLQNGMVLVCHHAERTDEADSWAARARESLRRFSETRPDGDSHVLLHTLLTLERQAELLRSRGLQSQAIDLLIDACDMAPAREIAELQSQDLCDRAWILRQDLIILLRDSYRADEAAVYLDELQTIQNASPRGTNPADVVHRTDQCRIEKLRADILFANDRPAEAVAALEKARSDLETLFQEDPNNSDLRFLLSTFEAKLGRILLETNEPEKALEHLLRDVELSKLEIEASQGRDQQVINDTASVTYRVVAETYAELQRDDEAEQWFRDARSLLPEATESMSRPTYVALQTVLQAWADFHAEREKYDRAVELREELNQAARPLIAAAPGNLKNLENAARNRYMAGMAALNRFAVKLESVDVSDLSTGQSSELRRLLEQTIALREDTQALLTELLRRWDSKEFDEPPTEDPAVLRAILSSMPEETDQLQEQLNALPEPTTRS